MRTVMATEATEIHGKIKASLVWCTVHTEGYEITEETERSREIVTHQILRFGSPSDPTLTVRIKGNVKVCVPNNISLMTPYVLLEQEDWFEDEISFVRSVLGSGDRVIDIGANYGIYTLTAAAVVGAQGEVWAFEPCTETAGFLRQSVGKNAFGNVEVMTTALSDRQGSGYLSLSPNSELNALTNDRNPRRLLRRDSDGYHGSMYVTLRLV